MATKAVFAGDANPISQLLELNLHRSDPERMLQVHLEAHERLEDLERKATELAEIQTAKAKRSRSKR